MEHLRKLNDVSRNTLANFRVSEQLVRLTSAKNIANLRDGNHAITPGFPMRITPYSAVPSFTHCRVPMGLVLRIVAKSWPAEGPRSLICGHRVLREHLLIINDPEVPKKVELFDIDAAFENRDENGRRPLSRLGRWFRVSLHACDACLRESQLTGAIVCPMCAGMIVQSGPVRLVSTEVVEVMSTRRDLKPYFVTAEHGTRTVVCETCAGNHEHMTFERAGYIWTGDGVFGPDVFSLL